MFSELKPSGDAKLGLIPRLYIYQDTLDRLQQLMCYAGSLSPACEVQFYLTCTRSQTKNTVEYVLDEMTFPPQEVQPAYVEASAEQQAAYSQDIQMRYGCLRVGAGSQPGTIRVKRYTSWTSPRDQDVVEEEILTSEFSERYDAFEAFKNRSTFWCHSHVNMAPTPSTTDEGQWREWLRSFLSEDNDPANADQRPPVVGMIIFNLKGNYFNRIKDNVFGVVHENLPLQVVSRDYYSDSFFRSYVAKKVAVNVTHNVGNKPSSSGHQSQGSIQRGYETYTDSYPTALSPGLLGILYSYPSGAVNTHYSSAVKELMKKRAAIFYQATSEKHDELYNLIKPGSPNFWELHSEYISIPFSATFQETIMPAWRKFIDGLDLGHDVHGSRAKNENLVHLILAIADAMDIENFANVEIIVSSEKDAGSDTALQKIYHSFTPSYGYCFLAIKIAQYLTSLQYLGTPLDYTFQKKVLDYLFNDNGEMESHVKMTEIKDLVIGTVITPSQMEKARHNFTYKAVSFESLIWTLGVLERWLYGDNSFRHYRVAIASSFSHFNKKNFPPPMLRVDLVEPSTSGVSGPRLVDSEALVLAKPADDAYSLARPKESSLDSYTNWLKNEYDGD